MCWPGINYFYENSIVSIIIQKKKKKEKNLYNPHIISYHKVKLTKCHIPTVELIENTWLALLSKRIFFLSWSLIKFSHNFTKA